MLSVFRARIGERLINTRDIQKGAYVWNMLSSCLNSFQTMILLMVLTHFGTETDSSVFVMAYAVGSLMIHVGKFGMRQFQVTDSREEYRYDEYVRSRYFSILLMIVLSTVYIVLSAVWKEYTREKTIVVVLIAVYKMIEAAEDVVHGRIQQLGRLDVAAKILTIRFAVFILGYAGLFFLTRDLVLTSAVNVCITAALCVVLNWAVLPYFEENTERNPSGGFPWRLVRECVPLCLSFVAYMYLTNAPKYVIDGLVADDVQTGFNIVFMPAFVVSLLSNFIFNPLLKKMGMLWAENKIRELKHMTAKLVLVPLAIDAVVLLVGYYLGPPVLGFIYGVDVRPYTGELVIFLLASGITALLNLFVALVTTMRKQRHLLYCYGAGVLLMLLVGRPVLQHAGLLALCWVYLAVLLMVALYCMAVYMVAIRKKEKATILAL